MQIPTSKRFASSNFSVFLLILSANILLAAELLSADSIDARENVQDDAFISPAATAIVVHGLNTTPHAMDPLAHELRSMGISVVQIALPGHRNDVEKWLQVERDDWIQKFLSVYRRVVAESGELPLFCIGFSLGSVVILDSLSVIAESGVDRLVLFAPAITPHWYLHAVQILGIFAKRWTIPSLTPEEYRANPGTSVAAYLALFEGIHHLSQTGFSNLRIPALVFMDPLDELVDSNALKRLIVEEELEMWNYIAIRNPSVNSYHHYIIDPENVGGECWSYMLELIKEFLFESGV